MQTKHSVGRISDQDDIDVKIINPLHTQQVWEKLPPIGDSEVMASDDTVTVENK